MKPFISGYRVRLVYANWALSPGDDPPGRGTIVRMRAFAMRRWCDKSSLLVYLAYMQICRRNKEDSLDS